jgi:hypothetical protein
MASGREFPESPNGMKKLHTGAGVQLSSVIRTDFTKGW